MKYVISLFDKTGNMVKPWIDAGYGAYIVDIQHAPGDVTDGTLTKCGADIFDWVPPRWLCNAEVVALFAFPPCTHLAVSGARWFKGKGLGLLAESIRMFERSAYWAEWFGVPYMIENPVSTISSYWRDPDFTFHPWEYAGYFDDGSNEYTKKTCLWTGNGFMLPQKMPREAVMGSKLHLLPPSDDRADLRSETPMGFAHAVFRHLARDGV